MISLSPVSQRYLAIRNVTLLAIFIDILLILLQFGFGIIGHSQALIAEALHTSSDLIVSGMTLVAAKYSTKPPDSEHPYGHGRFETLVTVAIGGLLLLVAISLLINSKERLLNPESMLKPANVTLIIAVLSFIIAELLYQYTMYVAKQINSPMLRANAWHHRSDAISSIVAFVGIAGSIAGILWLDIVATIGISLMIAYVGFLLSFTGISKLVDTGLNAEQRVEINKIIKSVEGVQAWQQLRTRWHGVNILVDVHVVVAPKISVSEGYKIAEAVRINLINKIAKINDVVVHIVPDSKEPVVVNLPFRNEITMRLRQCWQHLEIVETIEQITLHYLAGELVVDVNLPLSIVQNLKEAQDLSQRLTEATIDLDIHILNIYFRSDKIKTIQIFKVGELVKLIQ